MGVRELDVGVVGERTTRGGGRAAREVDRAGDGPAAAAVDDVEGAHGEHAREVGVGDVGIDRGGIALVVELDQAVDPAAGAGTLPGPVHDPEAAIRTGTPMTN